MARTKNKSTYVHIYKFLEINNKKKTLKKIKDLNRHFI